ncbi:hypothetical protein SAMN03159353_102844 [Cedecea sp. NFIX57]|nr:hypothetical protein SAMN03159353_102844 [Cedecea sp. NFIX57]
MAAVVLSKLGRNCAAWLVLSKDPQGFFRVSELHRILVRLLFAGTVPLLFSIAPVLVSFHRVEKAGQRAGTCRTQAPRIPGMPSFLVVIVLCRLCALNFPHLIV